MNLFIKCIAFGNFYQVVKNDKNQAFSSKFQIKRNIDQELISLERVEQSPAETHHMNEADQ